MLGLLDKFGEFCRTFPADEEYDYQDPKNCPIAKYAVSMGMQDQYYGLFDEKKIANPDDHYPFAEAEIYAATKPHTFGALADRIRDRVHADKFGDDRPVEVARPPADPVEPPIRSTNDYHADAELGIQRIGKPIDAKG